MNVSALLERGLMGSYSFHFCSKGEVLKTEQREMPDDLDTLDFARGLSDEGEIEVWSKERFVARVKQDSAPINASDANGG